MKGSQPIKVKLKTEFKDLPFQGYIDQAQARKTIYLSLTESFLLRSVAPRPIKIQNFRGDQKKINRIHTSSPGCPGKSLDELIVSFMKN